jgi:hypothetical protein
MLSFTRGQALLALLCAAGPAVGTPLAELGTSESVILTAATPRIRALDPLFLKITFQNPRPGPLSLPRPLGDQFGTLRLEMRPRGSERYSALVTKFHNSDCARRSPLILAKSEIYTTYEILFHSRDGYVFTRPGVYELRVAVFIEDQEYRSKPITLRVAPISDAERLHIERLSIVKNGPVKTRNLLNTAIGVHPLWEGPDGTDISSLTAIEKSLSISVLKQTLRCLLTVHSVGAAQTPAEKTRAQEMLATLQTNLDPVTRESLELILALQYFDKREWTELDKAVRTIPERSFHRDSLEQQLDIHNRSQIVPTPK